MQINLFQIIIASVSEYSDLSLSLSHGILALSLSLSLSLSPVSYTHLTLPTMAVV